MANLDDHDVPEECWLNIDPHPSIDGYVYHDYGPYQEGDCSFRYVREDLVRGTQRSEPAEAIVATRIADVLARARDATAAMLHTIRAGARLPIANKRRDR